MRVLTDVIITVVIVVLRAGGQRCVKFYTVFENHRNVSFNSTSEASDVYI